MQYELACRELAAKMADANDKRAVELMADAWAKVAGEQQKKLEQRLR